MAVFVGRRDGSMRVKSPTSPRSTTTTTMLADGFTEDGRLSPYDSMRRSSQYSLASTLNARISIGSGGNLDESAVIDEMLQRIGAQRDSLQLDRSTITREKPIDWFGKAKYYYEKFNLRYVAPFVLLLVYSIVGAWLFYWVEYENEKELLKLEAIKLERLRNETFHRLKEVMTDRIRSDQTKLYNSRDVLVWYEKQLARLALPEGLEWDMWGALFYVGTLFTTIGYGNIAPRTTCGQALSIMYALIGIPLVLAILNQFGKTLTKFVSNIWMRYRQCIKGFTKRKRIVTKSRTSRIWSERSHDKPDERDLLTVEEGNISMPSHSLLDNKRHNSEFLSDELLESRTIPVWLALFICIAWICFCAGLFCLWETQWSYFTSLYFFFISLSTIGLGDVVPDHPHMLILMFWLVIIGLSIVSMLLSVIQIKIEEWLYNLMIRMQKEYQRALASGDPIERQAILDKLMKKEPWFMRNMAQHLISENQAAQLDQQAEAFERSVRQTNNKNIQTEPPPQANESDHIVQNEMVAEANEELLSPPQTEIATRCSADNTSRLEAKLVDVPTLEKLEKATSVSRVLQPQDTFDSFSDAVSFPFDEPSFDVVDKSMQVSAVSCADRSQQFDPLPASVCGVQTDIAQFQVDEIMLKLHDLQEKSKVKPMLTDRSMETSLQFVELKDETSEETDKAEQISQSTQYDLIAMVADISVTADLSNVTIEEGTETEQNEYLLNRSMETDAWMAQLQMPECSRAVQTYFDEDDMVEQEDLVSKRPKVSKQQQMNDEDVNERSTQCEIESADTCDTCVQTMLEMRDFDADSVQGPRSGSLISLHGSDIEEPPPVIKQDLIIQTDDSYLKIARRLDEIRNNRTASLHICAAKPLAIAQAVASNAAKNQSESFTPHKDRPSERRGYSNDPVRNRRKSFKKGADNTLPPNSPSKIVSFSTSRDGPKTDEETDVDSLQAQTDVS